jgi:hypothetical protein
MPFYRCEICGEDGRLVAKDVTVTIEERTRDGERQWYGTITVTHLSDLASGQHYRLILADGRTGTFRVRRNTFAGGVDRAVSIDGVGPLASG